MSIDKTGKWWKGDNPQDLQDYLVAYSADNSYLVDQFRLAKCSCGSEIFLLWADDDEGCAKRVCTACAAAHFVCDSEEFYPDPEPPQWSCVECGGKSANVGAGFSLYENGHVRWLYVGERCTTCGVLGCPAQWKVAYEPSDQLLDMV